MKDNIPKLKETFINMRAEIVKLLKKKRRTFSQLSTERSSTSQQQEEEDHQYQQHQQKADLNEPLKLRKTQSTRSELVTKTARMAVNGGSSDFQTPEKGQSDSENDQTNQSVLSKRHFKQDYERELELFLPSKFFVVTNVFFKSKHLKV